MTSPLFARPMARALGAPLARLDGMPGHLARQNAARSPRRTSSTAAALMIGLALVVTVSVVADSLKSSLTKVLDEQANADWFVCVGDCTDQFSGFSPRLGEDLEALPEVGSVATYRWLSAAFRTPADGTVHGLMSVNTTELDAHVDVDPVAGEVNDPPFGQISGPRRSGHRVRAFRRGHPRGRGPRRRAGRLERGRHLFRRRDRGSVGGVTGHVARLLRHERGPVRVGPECRRG